MRKKVCLCVLLGVCAGASYAQGSVTLYGILDEGLIFNDNAAGHRQNAMVGSVLSGNRFGLLGSEDLGGGTKAVFRLENGFDINTGKLGQGGLMFGRQVYVGFTHPRWGSVTVGRQYDASIDYVGPLAASSQWGGYIVTNPGDIENFSAANHLNNSIKYQSVNLGGLTFGGVYSLGGVAGDFTQNQIVSLGASYVNGSLAVGTAYLNARNPNASFYATSLPNATAATNNFYTPVNSGYASAHTLRMVDIAAAWTAGPVTFGMNYSNSQFKGLSGKAGVLNPAGLVGDAAFNDVALNLRYRVSPALMFGGQASYSHGSAVEGKPGGKYGQFELGTLYSLSKRTDFYATAVYQVASGTQSTGTRAVASIFALTPSSSNRQAALRLAIRHTF